jgi:hypothetical protein
MQNAKVMRFESALVRITSSFIVQQISLLTTLFIARRAATIQPRVTPWVMIDIETEALQERNNSRNISTKNTELQAD